MFNKLKLRWARKLMQAKYFVVLTDKDSVIAFDGVTPDKFKDFLALQSQAAAIAEFINKLQDLQKLHDEAIASVDKPKGNRAISSRNTKTKVKKG